MKTKHLYMTDDLNLKSITMSMILLCRL